MGLSGLLWPRSNPGDRSSRVDVRHDSVCPDLRMFTGGEVQTTFPEKTSVRCIVDPKGKFRKTAGPRPDTSGEDPGAGMAGSRAIVLDVEFVGVRRKHFPGLRIVGLDGDKGNLFVLKSESSCDDDLRVRGRDGCRLARQTQHREGNDREDETSQPQGRRHAQPSYSCTDYVRNRPMLNIPRCGGQSPKR